MQNYCHVDQVVVKIINKAHIAKEDKAAVNIADQFYREMQIISSIRHPNIIEGRAIYEGNQFGTCGPS
jgi:hypothetical protein